MEAPIMILLTSETVALMGQWIERISTFRPQDSPDDVWFHCTAIDFSGGSVSADVIWKGPPECPLRLWLPHHSIRMAVDFLSKKPVGFGTA